MPRPARRLAVYLVASFTATLFALLGAADTALAATITVTSTGDTTAVDGPVTLREAIQSVNASANFNADVVAVHPEGAPPYVIIANRDGLVKVVLIGEAAKSAGSIRVGDYLEADGEKVNELLFEATDVSFSKKR